MNNDFCTSKEFPEIPEEGASFGKSYINHTKGLWVRKNLEDDVLEIWLDGSYFLGWSGADEIEVRLQAMLRKVFELGKARGEAQNQKMMRKALGLDNGAER